MQPRAAAARENDAAHEKILLCRDEQTPTQSASRASPAGRRRNARSFALSSREFAGRRVGVGYSAVVMRLTLTGGRPSRSASAKSPRRGPPRSLRLTRSCDRRRGWRQIGDDAWRQRENRVGDVQRIGGIAALIGDDADFVAGLAKPQHRLDEIDAERPVDPGGAQDQRCLGAARRLFSPASFERP